MEAALTARTTGKTSREILRMVQLALDEFETASLSASVRRAMRIAVLLGEARTAMRLSLELRPAGGHPKSNRADLERLLLDEGSTSDSNDLIEEVLGAYFADRAVPGEPDKVAAYSLDELTFWEAENGRFNPLELSNSQYDTHIMMKKHMALLEWLARQRTFNLLCTWERQLTFATTNGEILSGHQARVDALLGTVAPAVLDQFNLVFRRLDEAVESGSAASTSELLSQAVTSCRRILKAVVDVVQPADPAMRKSEQGHALNDAAYKNRLFEYLKNATPSRSLSEALTSASNALWERFTAVDTLSSKGVHAEVARDEAGLCALNCYLMAGEILQLQQRTAESDASAT